ncbi:hypothetical protein GSI_07314 [Ganoderma sinense ZZ0214-1]|uniref:Uncharacterized protein n=1 Tax=Ganoderma sinense ZZ0214-1 TaxID=1077348 RepID=A0A2G8SA18_9APHY|nr:hypothetical protein GSI_07314 [Ganoderma sinense ZZ0214-1]
MDIHSYTLKVITQIALYTDGGVDYNLSTPHTMVFVLGLLSDGSGKKLHPSKAFRIVGAEVFHRDRNPVLDALWEVEHVKERERMLRLWQGEGDRCTPNPALAGAFPTAFFVTDVGTGWYGCCDVYRPSRHPDGDLPDEPTRLAFEDLEMMCTRAIHGGSIYEASEDPTQVIPTAAVYLPLGNGWKKISTPEMLANSVTHDRAIHPNSYVSGLPLEKIWEVYKNW